MVQDTVLLRCRNSVRVFIFLFVVAQQRSWCAAGGCGVGKGATTTTTTTTKTTKKMHDGGLFLQGESSSVGTTSDAKTYSDTAFVPTTMKNFDVKALIVNNMAEITMEHTFRTPECYPVDYQFEQAVYQLPLEPRESVTGFEAEIDGRIVEAMLQKREEAQDMYAAALEEGSGAFLVEESRADVFHIVVGNVPPNQDVVIRLTYVTTLVTLGPSASKFLFPRRLVPPFDYGGDLTATMSLDVRSSTKIGTISSANHAVSVERVDDHRALVRVTETDPTTADLVVLLSSEPTSAPVAYAGSSTNFDSTFVMVPITPSASESVAIEWGEDATTVVELTSSVRVFVFNLFPGENSRPDSVTLRFESGSVLSLTSDSFVQLNGGADGEYDFLHQIACHNLILDLEYEDEHGNADKIQTLALRYNVASSQTSFVAVDNLDWTGVTDVDENTDDNFCCFGTDDDDDEDGAGTGDDDNVTVTGNDSLADDDDVESESNEIPTILVPLVQAFEFLYGFVSGWFQYYVRQIST